MDRRQIRAVQIGACDGDFTRSPFDRFQQTIFTRGETEALLLEPSPTSFAKLQVAASRAAQQAPRLNLTTQNRAVCGTHAVLPFYHLAPSFREAYDAPHWIAVQTAGFSREHVTAKLADTYGVCCSRRAQKKANEASFPAQCTLHGASGPKPGKSTPERNQLEAALASKYLIVRDIECVPPRAALGSVGWLPHSIDVLMVDAEGGDADIVNAFLDLHTVPALLVFEHTFMTNEVRGALLARLAEAGYLCRVSKPKTWADTICTFNWAGTDIQVLHV